MGLDLAVAGLDLLEISEGRRQSQLGETPIRYVANIRLDIGWRHALHVAETKGEIDEAFGNTPIIVADKRDGKALFGYQGPFRLVCPNDKAGARSVRMLESLELVRLRK